jgi:membrane fusion protein, multidrug efflux system
MARRNFQNAQGKLASLTPQLAAIAANLNGDPDGPVERNPRYVDAVAQRDDAARQLAHTSVRAPFAGIVTDHVWVDANPKETELTYVRPGQPVTLAVDTYPDEQWRGTVESISPAASQEFSLLPGQNTSGNWVKVVRRIPMRVRVDTSDSDLPAPRLG